MRSVALAGTFNAFYLDFRAPIRSALNPGPFHGLIVIPAFVAYFCAPAHDNDFAFGRVVVAPHPNFSEFFVKHDRVFSTGVGMHSRSVKLQ